MAKFIFKVQGMDCAEEVAVLKRELGPLVGDTQRLYFDLLQGKLTVDLGGESIAETEVLRAIKRTGMTAISWDEHVKNGKIAGSKKDWRFHSRKFLCAASGILTALGFLSHTLQTDWISALSVEQYPGIIIAFYLGAVITGIWHVLPKALYAIRQIRPDMNLLMTIAVIGAMIIGEWFEAASVSFLFAAALLLESWSVGRARHAIGTLLDLAPATARVKCPKGCIEEVPVENVSVGAIVSVRPGEKVPLDGILTQGTTSLNEATITGESVPVMKEIGSEVFAGTLNNEGAFEFRVTHLANDTTLARIIHMVEEAELRRAPFERWVDQFAAYYTPIMLMVAILIFVVPPLFFNGDWHRWFYEALVIMVIACPCALVISTPVSIIAGLTAAARRGVLIKGGAFLEAPARIRAIALDKTGTLTHGQPEVQRVIAISEHTEAELLERAAALETLSEHPIARAIIRHAEKRNIPYTPASTYHAIKGKGAEGLVKGRLFWIGNHRFVHERNLEHPGLEEQADQLEDAGHSLVFVGNENHVCGLIGVADQVKDHAKKTIEALHKLGIKQITMLTGDNAGTARAVANATGVDEYQAELLPEDKVAVIEELVRKHNHVAMVGDGVNDAPAMAASTVGIAMGAAGSDAAIETADIALMADDLTRIPWLIAHSKRTMRIIHQNTWFALGTKAAFLALALFGIATLWMAIVADMGASLVVIFNGLRLLQSPRHFV